MASVAKVSILDYFNIVFEGENGKIESNCKACGTRIQAKRSVTSNFVTHLKRKHQAMYDDFVKRKDMKREGYSTGSLHTFTSNGGNTRFSVPITTGGGGGGGGGRGGVGGMGTLDGGVGSGGGATKFDRHDPRQVLISEAIAKMIVLDLQPVSIVENQGFRELLQFLEPRYTPEHQHYIQSQLLPAYAYQVQLTTRQALASAHALSLSLDLWRGFSGATSGYLSVTCHFLTSDWQMRSALLACLPLTGGTSGNRILSEFDEVCHSHGVSGRAFRVVADPFLATATTKPCCLPGFLVSPHLTSMQDDNSEDEVDNGNDAEEGIRNGHGDGADEGEWEDSWEQGLGVCRVDCFSRSLEQCVREGLRSCPQLSSTLAKAACFYNYITSAVPPEKLSQVFDGTGLMMGGPGSAPSAVRDWAAQLKVLRRLLDSVEFLEEVSGPGELAPSASERALLRELTDTLEPFTEAWDMVHGDRQAERHVSISLGLPCVLGLRKHLSETLTPNCPSLLVALSQALERRLAPILEDPLYITATTLDPQFKLTWSSNPDWHRQVLIEELSKHSAASSPVDLNTEPHPQSQTPPAPSPAPSPVSSLSRPCKLFSFIKQRPATQAKSLEQELSVYLREEPTDEDALHYWRRKAIDFPLLAQVAKRAFTIPACGTVVGNIFTTAERCLRLERSHILPKNLETLIYLKANYRLLWT
ncbi:zinc finger BED domain-containing protein 4 [Paralichthys olivaceus]|uniref:zinc finger BED domain-containing protein 4 n=1 Tax=Paralichthys olivaceus TaxID=8255 RepID=UPI00097DEFD8|nr:PREDICTED: zinc finger BED domain-containing protein 4-like [Paralichthys olivaceus]